MRWDGGKIIDLQTLAGRLAGPRAAGKTIALANGAFDLLHVGHVRYLVGAAQLADLLIVAVNSDRSVRALKGADRPIIPQDERAEMVAALEVVDAVVIFEETDVRAVIAALRPDVHVKGSDYMPDTIPERDAVLAYGGRVAVAGDKKGHSTSTLLEKLGKGR